MATKLGFKSSGGDGYAYMELPQGGTYPYSVAIGLQASTGAFVISSSTTAGATLEVNPSIAIAPSTGLIYLDNVYGNTVGATYAIMTIDNTGLIGSEVNFTPGGGPGGVSSWIDVTGTTQAIAVNTGYTANNASLITFTLPSTAAYGTVIRICGKGAGGWTIHQNASQSINFGILTSTVGTGGSISSTQQYNTIELLCAVANTTFTVLSAHGNLTVV